VKLSAGVLGLAGLLLAGCAQQDGEATIVSQGPVQGGNGSETTNGFTLLVVNLDGTPATSVQVKVRPSDSMAGSWGDSLSGKLRTRLDTISDQDGHVSVIGLVRGNYTVELRQGDARTLAHQTALPELPYGGKVSLSQAGTPRLQDIRLAGCTLNLFGLDRSATADNTGYLQFDSLPVGTYSFRAWKNGKRAGDGTFLAKTGTSATLLSFELAGSANDPTGFKYASALSINASVGYGNILASFKDFAIPLSLDRDNFEFTGATSNALKFVSPRGTTLPYEVESWDTTTRTAKIWLRLDSILGLTDNQMIQMYWGGAAQPSKGSAFDTATNWWGVWHLRQSLKDATPYLRTATGTAAGVEGWYSNGKNVLTLPGLPPNADSGFTVSLWILPDTAQRAGAPILRQISTDASPFELRMGPFSTWIETHYPNGQTKDNQFPTTSAQGEWLFISVTYDSKKDVMKLFLNGQQVGDPATNLNASNVKMSGSLLLGGADSVGIGFKGLVKEVRLSRSPRSAEWINAEYNFQTERMASRAVTIQRLR
jgi:Concanavalin A-like lectin/glucanases superfamily/Domain of unknown function (DUF2341)